MIPHHHQHHHRHLDFFPGIVHNVTASHQSDIIASTHHPPPPPPYWSAPGTLIKPPSTITIHNNNANRNNKAKEDRRRRRRTWQVTPGAFCLLMGVFVLPSCHILVVIILFHYVDRSRRLPVVSFFLFLFRHAQRATTYSFRRIFIFPVGYRELFVERNEKNY